jgi:hypothetical protein
MSVRRALHLLVLAIAAQALNPVGRLEAQERPWAAGLEINYNAFAGGASDTEESRVLPTNRFGLTALGTWSAKQWILRLEAGFAPGHIAARDSGSTIELVQLGSSMPRYRIEPLIGRTVTRAGAGVLVVYLGPTLDRWSLDAYTRFTIGGEVRLSLQAPLGRVLLENYIGFGLAPHPFPAEELDPTITTHTLETLALGVSLRYRF